MSLHFYAVGEDNDKEESINNYKDLFLPYLDNPPSIEDALKQIFISGGLSSNEINLYINDINEKINDLLNKKGRESKIKEKYPNITHNDCVIISSYTLEALNSEYSPYRILNRNLANDDRKEGLNKVSKYLYLLLKSLRKLKVYYPSDEQKYLYRGISIQVETKIDPYNSKLVPYLRNNKKTFWAFTSTSWKTSTALKFLEDNGYHEEKKLKKGTFFSLYGKVYGYDITLFNKYNEEEILLEPEKKFRIENVIPDPNGIINVTCEILDSPNILNHLENYSKQEPFYLINHFPSCEEFQDIHKMIQDEINLDKLFDLIIDKLEHLESQYNKKIFYDNKNNYQKPRLFWNTNSEIMNIYAYPELKQEIPNLYCKMSNDDLEKEVEDYINGFIKKYREYYEKYGELAETKIAVNYLKNFYRFSELKIKSAIKELINTLDYGLVI